MRTVPVVDLVVGTALFRDLDVGRLKPAGMNVIGLTIATAWPNLRGSLSGWHFRSLGMPASAVASHMAVAEWLTGRVRGWTQEPGADLRLIRTAADLDDCLKANGPLGILLGVQGGHVLDGDIANVARLREAGVRMFAPAHVMDNALVGSGTGRRAGGLTGYGREVVAELEAHGVIVDLAHMSVTGIEDSLASLRRPFVLSHTGLTNAATTRSRWRRYSAATRNIPASLAADVAGAGGLVGIVLSTELLGGSTLDAAVRTFKLAIESCGDDHVAIGSDMDGALRIVISYEGLPALADSLLTAGVPQRTVAGVLGANAIRVSRTALAD